jgi:hypothetical protein
MWATRRELLLRWLDSTHTLFCSDERANHNEARGAETTGWLVEDSCTPSLVFSLLTRVDWHA